MPCKKPGRFKRVCAKCKTPFSTHSTKRGLCHRCFPKCTEKHSFNPVMAKLYKQPEPAAAPAPMAPPAAPVAYAAAPA